MDSRILICGNDPGLLQTRQIVLRTNFPLVTTAVGKHGLQSELDGSPADLVILCHSLAENEQRGIVDLLHVRWPGARILVLIGLLNSSQEGTSEELSVLKGPQALIDRAKRMTTQ